MTEPITDSQVADLRNYLAEQRQHVLGILDGLPEEDLHRPVVPSGWSCAGLVQHLALDVERFWFGQVMAGEEREPGESGDDSWQLRPGASGAAALGLYQREIDRADAIIARTGLDSAPVWWPDFFPPGFRLTSLRQVLLHVITETACHAGHLDAACELIDGRQWLVLS